MATLQSSAGGCRASPCRTLTHTAKSCAKWREWRLSSRTLIHFNTGHCFPHADWGQHSNRKTLDINRVLILLLPHYFMMKHTSYFCRKFGGQFFLVLTEQAPVKSQHFPRMMKKCYDIRKKSDFVLETCIGKISSSLAFYIYTGV